LGIDVKQNELDEVLQGVESPARPHLARVLVEKGIVSSTAEAFEVYLGEGKPAYVKKERPSASEIIAFLRSIGAVPVVAHPLTIGVADLRALLKLLKHWGIVGVEVEYDYTPVGTLGGSKDVRAAARGLGLIETGGSDYHGTSVVMADLGTTTVSVEVIERLRKAAKVILSEG
ncbi:MAG: phosphatase, partial [Candidatus Thorarchaeota archaeon]